MEADLQRFYGRDYRDRWRQGPDGRRLLTLRQIWVYVSHLPADSALGVALELRTQTDVLLADIHSLLAGQAHPLIQERRAPARDPEREQQIRAARRRARERQKLIDAGEIT